MGKVQDTISRIARRSKHQTTPSVALIIPSQQKPTSESFPTAYNSVASWLSEQATASQQARIVGLTRALQHSNRLQNSAAQRLRITALFASQAAALLPCVKQKFIGTDIPYNNDARNAFETTTTVLQELSYGYKIAVVDVLLRRGNLRRIDRLDAIYHAMRYLGDCGLRHSQSYQPWPDKFWRDINTLYWLAEKDKGIDETIATATDKDNIFPASIRNLYSTLALFHLSNNDHLHAPLMEQLVVQLARYSGNLVVTGQPPVTSVLNLHSVAINSANPPSADRYRNYTDEDQIRYLDLQPVYDALLSAKDSSENEDGALSRQQLQKILHIWSHQTKRTTARTITNQKVSIETGLKDIHALYSQMLTHPEQITNNAQWTLVNRNQNGFCLHGHAHNQSLLRVGELITCTVTEKRVTSLYTGVIRWIKNSLQDDLQLGIELIGTNVQSVLCVKENRHSSVHDSAMEALTFDIGTQGFSSTMVLMPAGAFRLGDVIVLQQSDNNQATDAFKLTGNIDYDGRFDCFRINSVATTQNETAAHV